jgi:CheY-like chemotaxis protein
MAKILVIEDNLENMELIVYLLNAFGHTPLEAADGQIGLATAEREIPDMILCDLQMPVMDGYQVVKRLKLDPKLAAIPIVAITAYAMVGDQDKILANGFDGYLSKPINPETFIKDIEKFLPHAD